MPKNVGGKNLKHRAVPDAGMLRNIESRKFNAAKEALMEAVVELADDDASFAEFEKTLLAVSNELGRRISKKKCSK